MTQQVETSVRKTITVAAPQQRAFDVFTQDMMSWWPTEHHILQSELVAMVFEPRVGGQIYDQGADGSECHWGRVLAYEPPQRVIFSWQVTPQWQIETDLAKTSEVEVRFIAESPERTRVELEHRKLERHGPGWEAIRDAVASPGGWPLSLQRFTERLTH